MSIAHFPSSFSILSLTNYNNGKGIVMCYRFYGSSKFIVEYVYNFITIYIY